MKGAAYNYPAGIGDADFDDDGYYAIYREDMREREADGMQYISYEKWLEYYFDTIEEEEEEEKLF